MMNAKLVALVATLVYAASLSSMYLVHEFILGRGAAVQTPPVVVVDLALMAMKYPEGATAEEVEELMMKTNRAVLALKSAGYLVLDSSAVIAAPADLYLPTDLVE